MKTNIGRIGSFAALLIALTPLVATAQNVAGHMGSVGRRTERYTLLTGPYLLSPPHGAPQAGETIVIPEPQLRLSAAPFHFAPPNQKPVSSFLLKTGLVPVGGTGAKTPAPTPARSLPKPESLKFNQTLELPAPAKSGAGPFEFKRG